MYLVAIGWLYVVLMMAVAEALSSQGSVLGAVITFVFYGVLPLLVVMYIMGTPARRRARLAADPLGRENYDFAQKEKFLLREDRTFLKLVSTPHGVGRQA